MATPKTFPAEFEGLLSARGRRLLRGKDEAGSGVLARERFFSADDLLDPKQVALGTRLLAQAFTDTLEPLGRELPGEFDAPDTAAERLPKVGRMWTTPMGQSVDRLVVTRAIECGLLAMLESQSYRAFAQALAGAKVDGPEAMQVLCYREGDYAGPHTDHHPTDARAAKGYVDVHLSFCTPGIAEQLLVYQQGRHLTQVRSIRRTGTVTAYRLPFWHYTTPLQVKPGKAATARRWLVLGTFFDPR